MAAVGEKCSFSTHGLFQPFSPMILQTSICERITVCFKKCCMRLTQLQIKLCLITYKLILRYTEKAGKFHAFVASTKLK